jgi:hypothetical protein
VTGTGQVWGRQEMLASVELGGVRTMFAVPMLKEKELVVVFALNRQEVRPFSEKQIGLRTNFVAEAAIALDHAALLNQPQQRDPHLRGGSIRRRRRRCSGSFPNRRAICSRYFRLCWRAPSASATLSLEISTAGMATCCA